MKPVLAVVGIFFGLLILICLGGWLVEGNNFFLYRYFAPKQAEVERKVFEETPSFVQGNNQELQKQYFDYIKATPEQKAAMKSIILHEAAGLGPDGLQKLSPEVRSWIQQLQSQP